MSAENQQVDIHDSARTHGVSDADIMHAMASPVHMEDLDNTVNDDFPKVLILGPDRASNDLELVALITDDGPLVIHAMRMRPQFAHLLPGRKRRR